MRIEGWRIDGFGLFRDAVVEDVPPGLTVVAGPNEAGKSTLLAFLRGVLFGFPDGRMRARRHEPVHGGRHGGAVHLADTDGAVWSLERHSDTRTFTLRRPDGSVAPDQELDELLGHADATLFANVFAFGLSELDSFEILDSDAVRDRVFSAGVIGAGRSAREALATLDARRRELVRPRGRCIVRDLSDEARTAQRQLAAAQAASADLQRRRDDVERLAELAERRRIGADRCRADQQRLRALLEVWPARNRVAEIDDELDDLVVPDGLDETVEVRYERVRAELSAATVAMDEAELDLATALERRDGIRPDPALSEVTPEVTALAGDLAVEESRSARLAELDREVESRRELLDEELARLGPDWDRDRLASFDVSIPTADDVRRWGRRLAEADGAVRDAESERGGVAGQRASLEAEIAALGAHEADDGGGTGGSGGSGAGMSEDELDRRRGALRQLRATLVDLGSQTARLDAAERTLDGLRRIRDAAGPTRTSSIGPIAVGLGVVLGLVAIAARIGGDADLAAVLAASGAAVALVGVLILVTRRAATSPSDAAAAGVGDQILGAEHERDEARSRVEILRASIRASALVLGLPAEPSALDVEECAAALDDASRASRAAEERRARLSSLRARRDELAAREQQLEDLCQAAVRSRSEVGDEWERWTTERGVGADLDPDAVNDLFTAVDRARGTLRSLQSLEREWRQLDEASTRWRSRAAGVLDRLGAEGSDDLLVDFRALAARVESDVAARAALAERAAAVEEAEHRAEVACDRVAVARQERDEIFAAARVDDDVELRRVLAEARRLRELTEERGHAWEQIRAVLGRGEASASALAELERGDPGGWEATLAEEERRLPDLEAEHTEAIRMHHDAARQLEELSRSGDVAEAALRAEAVRARLADAVGEWETLSAARHLIGETLARYERERQPAVLARAEEMFAAVTDGHYRALAVADGELVISDAAGRHLGTDDLSRGTAEQLYLCIRFGLAAEMAAHTPLPFVMDDVLVNFDPERTRRMAEVIAGLAREHQVLVFTCQPTTVAALEAAAVDLRRIDLPRHGGRD